MTLAKSRIPHITYVEEVDVTALEDLRAKLNVENRDRPRLTILPFLMRAMVKAIGELPKINAHYDDEGGIVRRYAGVHIGVAVQTEAGLTVPVVRHTESRDLWDCAAELTRLSEAARTGTATREELAGSTITITSLGALGGLSHANHQPPGSGDHRREQDHRAPAMGRPCLCASQDDESPRASIIALSTAGTPRSSCSA